jgi:hypothetical protein
VEPVVAFLKKQSQFAKSPNVRLSFLRKQKSSSSPGSGFRIECGMTGEQMAPRGIYWHKAEKTKPICKALELTQTFYQEKIMRIGPILAARKQSQFAGLQPETLSTKP